MHDKLQPVLQLAQELPAEDLPRLLGDLEQARCTALVRLTMPVHAHRPESEELLSIEDACSRLSVSKDFLYRHSKEYPFTRKMGRKLLFSSLGIDQYIRQHDGSTARRQRF